MNTQPSWKLRPLFLGCMAIGCISVVILWPFVQEKAIYIPFGVLAATLILPDLICPNRVSLEIDETGVTYSDFSQQIHAPWTYITGFQYELDTKRVEVYVNFPRANFSVRTTHPHFERLKRKLEEYAKPVV